MPDKKFPSRAAEKLLLGEANISTAGAGHIEMANLVAYEMILKYGFSKRLGPVALMVGQKGYLGENAISIADLGPEMSAAALTDVKEVQNQCLLFPLSSYPISSEHYFCTP